MTRCIKQETKQKSKGDLFHFGQLASSVLVVTQVLLVPHEDDGNVRTEMLHFWRPLLRDVL